LQTSGNVEVEIFNLEGKAIYRLNTGRLQSGINSLEVEGKSLSTGIYIISINAENQKYVTKILKF